MLPLPQFHRLSSTVKLLLSRSTLKQQETKMPSKDSVNFDAGYPLYAAAFADDNTLLVTGGGGEGNNGIPNKLSAISIDLNREKPFQVAEEHEFKEAIDSPTAIAISSGLVLLAANEPAKNIEAGKNKSLRKFSYVKAEGVDGEKAGFDFQTSVNILDSKDPMDYIKLISISDDASVAAVVSSEIPSTVHVIDPKTLQVLNSIEEDKEVKDVSVSADGKRVAYITEGSLVVIEDGEALSLTYNKFTSNYNLVKVRWATNDKVVVAVNLRNGDGVLMLEAKVVEDPEKKETVLKTTKARVFSNKFQKITGLAVTSNSLIAVVGNDNSITILDASDFSVCKRLEKVHTFATTGVAFSPDGKYLASASAASTVNVYKIPDNIKVKYTSYYWAVFFLLLASGMYYVYENVPREKFVAVTEYLDSLFDDEAIPPSDPRYAYLHPESSQSSDTTTHETLVVVDEKTVVEDGDIVSVVTESIVIGEEAVTGSLLL